MAPTNASILKRLNFEHLRPCLAPCHALQGLDKSSPSGS